MEYFIHDLIARPIQYQVETLCKMWKGVQKVTGIPNLKLQQRIRQENMVTMVLMLEGKGLERCSMQCLQGKTSGFSTRKYGDGMVKYCQQHTRHNIYLQNIQQKQLIVGGLVLLH